MQQASYQNRKPWFRFRNHPHSAFRAGPHRWSSDGEGKGVEGYGHLRNEEAFFKLWPRCEPGIRPGALAAERTLSRERATFPFAALDEILQRLVDSRIDRRRLKFGQELLPEGIGPLICCKRARFPPSFEIAPVG